MSEEDFESNTPTITIGVAMHKEYNIPNDDIYVPIHVGADRHPGTLTHAIQDNTEINISSLNPYFSELTALYWLWKNCDSDYKGLVHYRRYLAPSSIYERHSLPRKKRAITRKNLARQLQSHNIILPSKRHYIIETIRSHYAHTLPSEQLNTARSVLSALSPQSIPAWDQVMGRRSAHMFNMMVMDKADFDAYCTWLFPILFECTKRLPPEQYDAFNARYPGRISELLMDTWILTNHKRYIELPTVSPEPINWWKKGFGFLMAKFAGRKYHASF